MAFSIMRIIGRRITWGNAGMPPVFVYRHAAGTVEEILSTGMPLGAISVFPYTTREISVEPGDFILLLSDGLPEQMNPEHSMFGYDRLQSILKEVGDQAPEAIIQKLSSSWDDWRKNQEQIDDITLIVIRFRDPVS